MYGSLLVPLDGSAAAEQALPMALSLARRFRAAVQIVHVYVPVRGMYGEGEWWDEAIDREMREGGKAYLDSVVQRLAVDTDISWSAVLLEGPVASTINRHVMGAGFDLIVMTTQGRGPVARLCLGSVADSLVRQTSIPILFVRPQEGEADLTKEPVIERLHVPLDGSELAEQILEPALAVAAATQAEITLIRVVQQLTPDSNESDKGKVSWIRPALLMRLKELDRQERATAEEYLERIAEQLRSRTSCVQARVVLQVSTATAIVDDASTHGADLIALATQGRGGLKRLLVGSVADKVLRGATMPVLVQRPVGEFASAAE